MQLTLTFRGQLRGTTKFRRERSHKVTKIRPLSRCIYRALSMSSPMGVLLKGADGSRTWGEVTRVTVKTGHGHDSIAFTGDEHLTERDIRFRLIRWLEAVDGISSRVHKCHAAAH